MMDEHQRDALLIRLDERTARLTHLIEGNGHPGMLHEVTVLKEDMRQREREADEIRGSMVSRRDQAMLTSGVISATMIGVFTAIKAVFFPDAR